MEKISDESARLKALDLHHSVIVQAPAGSGKTELLCRRFLTALLSVERPEQVLAITFTRKAANEMRERILRYLNDPQNNFAQKVLKRDEEKSWQLLLHPERLSIMTIDSLCARIVDQSPIASEIFGCAITDSPFESYEQAVDALFSDADQTHPWQSALHAMFLQCGNRWSKLRSLLTNMLAKREQWLMLLPEAEDPHAWRQRLEKNLLECVNESLDLVKKRLPSDLQNTLKALMEFAEYPQEDFFLGLPAFVLTKEGSVRKSVDKRTGFPLGEGENKAFFRAQKEKMLATLAELASIPGLSEALAYLAKAPTPFYTEEAWRRVLDILEVLKALLAYWQLQVQKTKTIDFTEVALRALFALGGEDEPSETALGMDARLQHILVDEFQDTSLLQYRLLERLTQAWENGDGRTLFFVGDPLQSIYRFRQAEVGLFLRVWEQGFGHLSLEKIQLTQNFRSDEKLVEFYNENLSCTLPRLSSMQEGAVAYVPVKASQKSRADSGVHFSFGGDDALIESLKDFHARHPTEKIAILVRSRTHLVELLRKLRAENMAYQARDLTRLADQPVVVDLLNWLSALLNLEDRLAWLSVLHAPWSGVSLSLIQELFEREKGLVWPSLLAVRQDLFQKDHEALLKFIVIWEEALALRQRQPLDQVLYSLWRASGAKDYWVDEVSLQAEKEFFRCLQTEAIAGDLPDFSMFKKILSQKSFTPKSFDAPWLEVMTIHKAKGLEFDAVFLPSLEKVGQHEDHPLLVFDEVVLSSGPKFLLAPMNQSGVEESIFSFIWYVQTLKANHERLRLLYVAATRAKNSLFFFAEDVEKLREGSFLSALGLAGFGKITCSPD